MIKNARLIWHAVCAHWVRLFGRLGLLGVDFLFKKRKNYLNCSPDEAPRLVLEDVGRRVVCLRAAVEETVPFLPLLSPPVVCSGSDFLDDSVRCSAPVGGRLIFISRRVEENISRCFRSFRFRLRLSYFSSRQFPGGVTVDNRYPERDLVDLVLSVDDRNFNSEYHNRSSRRFAFSLSVANVSLSPRN